MPPLSNAIHAEVAFPATLKRTLDYVEVKPGIAVVRLCYYFELPPGAPADMAKKYPASVKEGFALMQDIHKLEAGDLDKLPFNDDLKFVPASVLTRSGELPFTELWGLVPNKEVPFHALQAEEATAEDLVQMVSYSHTLCTYDGLPLPQPLVFDYIEGYSHNGAYHLEIAIPVLNAHPRVRPGIAPSERKPRAQVESLAIPAYNFRPGVSRYVAFSFTPTADELRQMCELRPKALDNDSERRAAVFELDLLGLRAAGATKYPDYYGSDEYSAGEEDPQDD